MAVVVFPRRRGRKLFDENNEINNTNPPPPQPPPPPPQEPFQLPPLPPLPPVNFPAIPPPPDQNSQFLSVALAIVLPVIVAVLALSCFLRGMELNRRRRRAAAQAQPQQQPPQESGGGEEVYSGLMVDHPIWYIRTVGIQSHVINAITVCKYKEVEGVVGRRAECAVCLNGFQQDDTLRMLPKCNHAFHVSCIDTWLKSHTNCPVCRAIIELVDVQFPGGGGNRPETQMGTPVDNRRGQIPNTNGESEGADPIDIPNLELRNNNVVKNENKGE